MAIDSAIKRRAAAGNALVFFGTGVTPNASKPAYWRRTVGYTYTLDTGEAPVATGRGRRSGIVRAGSLKTRG